MAGWLLQFSCSKFLLSVKSQQFYTKIKRKYRKILTAIFWKNSLVPDLAMVPRFLTRSSFVIPMPVSVTWRMLFSLSALILIDSSSVAARADLSVSDKNLILSNASEELEISSLKKIWKKKKIISTSDYYQVSFYFWLKIMLRTNWHHLLVVPKLMK